MAKRSGVWRCPRSFRNAEKRRRTSSSWAWGRDIVEHVRGLENERKGAELPGCRPSPHLPFPHPPFLSEPPLDVADDLLVEPVWRERAVEDADARRLAPG